MTFLKNIAQLQDHGVLSLLAAFALSGALGGCAATGAGGPSLRAVKQSATKQTLLAADIRVVEVDDRITGLLIEGSKPPMLSDVLGDGIPFGSQIGYGDVVDVSVWEAPPAVLFGTSVADSRLPQLSAGVGRSSGFPEQMVNSDGAIQVPYAGSVRAVGLTPETLGRDIAARLAGVAHKPQVIVRVVRNSAANVTVVGEVTNSMRVQVTAKGERLLDVLASAGGVRQPTSKVTIQVTRGARVASLPLDIIIRNPAQNIRLQADDIVTAMFQPYSFIALGATGENKEIPFEGTGLTLAQALGRAGGLRDERADAKGVFIFRFEDAAVVDPRLVAGARLTADGKIPVIYRLDLRNPSSIFLAQGFPIRNRDVLYVSNAPIADLQKFVGLISQMAFSIVTVTNSF